MMWSQWVWVRKIFVRMGPFFKSFASIFPASSRMPLPASTITSRSSAPKRSSRHAVLPPYFTVLGPGVGMDPRTPQNVRRMAMPSLRDLQEDLGLLDLPVHQPLDGLQVVPADAQLLEHGVGDLLGPA